jgi:hypothetical protein
MYGFALNKKRGYELNLLQYVQVIPTLATFTQVLAKKYIQCH